METSFVSVTEFGLEASAAVMARGFADYLVKIPATAAMLLHMARSDSVDLASSRVALRDGVPAGAALIARRGWTCRLAGMALVPEARRAGLGRALVTRVLEEARARGERRMELEVIEQNVPAVKLYEALGFARVRRLVGFSRPADAPREVAPGDCEPVDVRAAAAAVTRLMPADWPWQLSGETLAQAGPPAVAFRRGGAWLVCTDPAAATVSVRALVGDASSAETLLRAVMARHGAREWRIGALWPEEAAGVFVSAGFGRTELTQWQMARTLA